MAEYIKKIRTASGDLQIDYTALANLPAIINNLTSTSTTDILSAAQGKVLKSLIDGKVTTATTSLPVASWSSLSQTVSVSGVTDNNIVIIVPAPANYTEYHGCGVYCSAQGSGTLTFKATTKPTAALSVQIMIIS